MEKGPYVYELFSIMVHAGSANGGTLLCLHQVIQRWRMITYDDIQKLMEEINKDPTIHRAIQNSANAYMLIYRQIDKQKNGEFLSVEEFPEHIKANLQSMQDQEERERMQRELDRFMCVSMMIFMDSLECSFDGCDDEPMGELLGGVKIKL
ncbi:ubiquitin carboxyl-terminal hydrolase 47 [Caerostris extrusa]|uniref:Ubiquitin carboxyl-terminal hydrolase 47 n=1 Tax=Caerostris extrusa TaxID=172846 RepID=A0AAV4NQF5_CAEEX|nr:ubiquitin carboxyl-terminal hydrolase 47 [Caerostris extrusa]